MAGGYSPLKLPDLETFQYGPIEEISSTNDSIASEIDGVRDNDAEETDIWMIAFFDQYDASRRRETWEQFEDEDFQEPRLYLSEATQEAWNSVWIQHEVRKSDRLTVVPIKHSGIIRPLIDLGLGFSSSLFLFDAAGKLAPPDNIIFSGLSRELTLSVIQTIGACGESFRTIERSLVERIKKSEENPSMNALASMVRRVLNLTRPQILRDSSLARTILQIHNLYQRPLGLLSKLEGLLTRASQFETETALVNYVISMVQDHESHDQWFYPISFQILCMVSKSFLEDISVAIGLLPVGTIAFSRSPSLSHLLETLTVSDESGAATKKLPDLFDIRQELIIFQLHQSLKVLKNVRPDHLLNNSTYQHQGNHVSLELAGSWDGVDDIHAKTIAYQTFASQHLSCGSSERVDIVKKDSLGYQLSQPLPQYNTKEETFQLNIIESIDECNLLRAQESEMDPLATVLDKALQPQSLYRIASTSYPPIAVLMMESFAPLLSVQARLINHSCLRMIFKDGNLLHHLDVLYKFHLLGSGIFTTKLKQALFSSELSSTERKKGHHRAGNLGLRLGSRSTWPPANAELRLALTGMLSDCYSLSFPAWFSKSPDHLPGNLAFAIRNLSEPEIEACMDSTSLAALDFLRLQYKSDPALSVILTDKALSKYDHIIRFLLRLSRVSFAIDQIWLHQRLGHSTADPRMSRFTYEARHFVQTLVAHVHSTISSIWHRFYQLMASVERQLDHDVSTSSCSTSNGLFQLSALHGLMLDKIMFELLLRKRHEKVMQILNQILTAILEMASTAKSHIELLSDFRTNVGVFIAVCRNLSDRGDYGQQEYGTLSDHLPKEWARGAESESGLKNLTVSLDMNGWYSKEDDRS